MNARLAADALGATRMDRPEWTAINPANGEMYCTLTNNSTRTPLNTDAANPRAYTDPKTTGGQTNGNANGHIIRLREAGDTTEATAFAWDIYAFGAGSDLDPANINLSGLDATNDFSSPDGLWFGAPSNITGQNTPILWIETDDGAYTDVTNCMLLAAIPGKVGDGATKTITNTIGGATGTQSTRIGKAPGTTLRRILVGPKECELTGITSTPDGRSLFVNIQHPGENGSPAAISSSWPATQAGAATGTSRPRSATIVITRTDGGVVGL
jgi:secreted PhoX family phosphatase